MGRIFEKRKHKMFKRFDMMAKQFTRYGKEIAIAVKQGGPNPEYNPRLRTAIQNAKGINMPKDRIDNAIKRASEKDASNYEEIVYEGYGQFGVAILVEAATDNSNRTVKNVRMHFNKCEGTLGKTGSLDFIFERKAVFKFDKGELDLDSLELELIDFGCDDFAISEEGEVYAYAPYTDFNNMQKAFEERNIEVINANLERIPTTYAEVTETQEEEIMKLIERLEEEDDVQTVYHNMKVN